jgi:L-fuculose-phosphate aldolase
MLEHEGLIDYSGHISVRDPSGQAYWIHTLDKPRHAVTETDVVKVSLDDKVLVGRGKPPSERAIHAEIYRVRPDVGSVAHLHPPTTNAISIAGYDFVPVNQHGSVFGAKIPVLDDSTHIDTKGKGEKLAQVLGNSKAVIIRGHGVVVVGRDAVDCFTSCVYLEDNANHLWRALAATGGRMNALNILSQEEIEKGEQHFDRGTQKQRGAGTKVWDYYLQRLKK